MANNINPILISVLLLEFLTRLKESYNMFEFRIEQLKEVLNDHCRRILVNLYMPKEIRAQVKQRDLFNHNALYYMEKLDSFKLLDTKVMDRIMKDYWNSNVDSSGFFMSCSTCFNILRTKKLSHIDDYESKHRFYDPRDISEVRPHEYIYKVFVLSMQQRYFIEIIIFLVLATFFQIYIDKFNTGQLSLKKHIDEFIKDTENGTVFTPELIAKQTEINNEMN